MKKTQPPAVPTPRAALRDDVQLAANRCPYCHERVEVDAADWTSCRTCQARHHEACCDEAGVCSSCGAGERLVADRGRGGALLGGVGALLSVVGVQVGAYVNPLHMLRYSGVFGLITVLLGAWLLVRSLRQVARRASERAFARTAAYALALLGLGLLGSVIGAFSVKSVIEASPVSPTPEQLAEGAAQMWATVQLAGVCALPSFALCALGSLRARARRGRPATPPQSAPGA